MLQLLPGDLHGFKGLSQAAGLAVSTDYLGSAGSLLRMLTQLSSVWAGHHVVILSQEALFLGAA